MHEDIKPTELEGFNKKEKNISKLKTKILCCHVCYEALINLADYLVFQPEDAVKSARYEMGLRNV